MALSHVFPAPRATCFRAYRQPERARACACRAKDLQAERSRMVEREILLFVFQQELDVQLQRALNMEQFEAAKVIRTNREQIDAMITRTATDKGAGAGTGGGEAQQVATDNLSAGLTLQGQLNEAIEKEDYALAASLRDRLNTMKDSNALAAAEASEWTDVKPVLRLGQRVIHKSKGFQGIVVGWDKACCEADEWRSRNDVTALDKGAEQPFYHLLVDMRDWEEQRGDPMGQPPAAYVAEELLCTPEQEGTTWIQAYEGTDKLDFHHPFTMILYLGRDNEGNYIPTPALRSVYNESRRDVWPPPPRRSGAAPDESD